MSSALLVIHFNANEPPDDMSFYYGFGVTSAKTECMQRQKTNKLQME